MAASFVKFQLAVGDLLGATGGLTLNLSTDALKLALTNTTPVSHEGSWHYFSSLTEISASNGYSSGGATLTMSTATNSSGTWSVNAAAANPTWTSSTGNMGPFEWIVLYDSTPASDKTLFGYWDYGSALTLNGVNGDTFTVTFSVSGVPMQYA